MLQKIQYYLDQYADFRMRGDGTIVGPITMDITEACTRAGLRKVTPFKTTRNGVEVTGVVAMSGDDIKIVREESSEKVWLAITVW